MRYNSIAVIMASGILILSGCSRKGSEKANDSDSVAITEEAEAILTNDSVPEYYSDDLRAYGIKGDVMQRSAIEHDADIVYPEPTELLIFNENGNLTNPQENLAIERDEDGYNHRFSIRESDGTEWVMTYVETDSIGHPLRSEIMETGPQGEALTEITYSRYGYDRQGNWTVRKASMRRTFTDSETDEKSTLEREWKEICRYTYREAGAEP